MTIHQYAKTTHPEVLAAVRKNAEKFDAFMEKLAPISEKYTGDPNRIYWGGSATNGSYIGGIKPTDKPLPGQWRKPDRQGLRMPYKSNPVYSDFCIGTSPVPIPGRPSIIFGKQDNEGTAWMSHGAVFEHDGAVYSGVGFAPDPSRNTINGVSSDMDDFGWAEVPASEFNAAMDAVNSQKEPA